MHLRLILKPASRGFVSAGKARAYLRAMAQGMCIRHRREIEQAWLVSDQLCSQRFPYTDEGDFSSSHSARE